MGLFVVSDDSSQVRFLAPPSANWNSCEQSELNRLAAAYPPPHFDIQFGITEDGDPWCAVSDSGLDRVIVHIARLSRSYVVIFPDRNLNKKVAHIKTAIDLVAP